jgi:TonB family protein
VQPAVTCNFCRRRTSRSPMRWVIPSLALAFLWPVASRAQGVDIPELGVHIADAPGESSTPQLLRRFDGYLARLPIGKATLTVARLEDPVPPSSDVRDADYRATLQKEFNEDLGPTSSGRATVIAGHDAWTTIDARRSGHDSSIKYACVTYLVVDQHLYRVSASADGGDTRPPDFDAAVRVISELAFGPIDRSALQSGGAGSRLVGWVLPPCRDNSGDDYYPAPEARLGIQGHVLVEFSIDKRGSIKGLVIKKSARDNWFDQSARRLFGHLRCTVPDKWQSSGAADHRFTMDVIFQLRECVPRAGVAEASGYPDASEGKIVITGSLIREGRSLTQESSTSTRQDCR